MFEEIALVILWMIAAEDRRLWYLVLHVAIVHAFLSSA